MVSHDATLVFDYASDRRASVVAESVAREIGEIDDERSHTTLTRTDETVEITVNARDVTALRAALNTWFTLVDVAETVERIGFDPRDG